MVTNDLTFQKREDLKAVYARLISTQGINLNYVTRETLVDLLMNQPAPRFYLEPRTVEHLLMRYFKGQKTSNPSRTQDLAEAFRRVRERKPRAPMSDIWLEVSMQPAKSFYMSKRNIRDVIFNYKR